MCDHTNGMFYKTEKLEATADVRSVPLGEKRRKGRPKKIPNALVRSPVRAPHQTSPTDVVPLQADDELPVVPLQDDGLPVAAHDVPNNNVIDIGIRPSTRKRKRVADVPEQQSPVDALVSQILKPGLGTSKPPKKRAKNLCNDKADKASTNEADEVEESAQQLDVQVSKPNPVNCKKRIGTCSHEIVFSKHYNKVLWAIYADSIRKKKSIIEIDPDYMAA